MDSAWKPANSSPRRNDNRERLEGEGEPKPWSPDYRRWRERFIGEVLSKSEILEAFERKERLPAGYGIGLDERCIEYPWLISMLPRGPARLLDAGSSLNHSYILDQPVLRAKTLHVLTISPERECYWERTISYLFEDLRDIPIRDNYYDLISCISTLEHVGLDNTMFAPGKDVAENRPEDYLTALRELRRVLKPGGKLFVTVPYGRYENFGSFQQFDAVMVERLVDCFSPSHFDRSYFRYGVRGWDASEEAYCADAEYVDWIMTPRRTRPTHFPKQTDKAVAARAVACLLLIKR